MKQNRLENPTGWMALTRFESIRFIIDALLEAPPSHKFNKSEIARRSGLSREAVREHLDFLVDLGVLKELDDAGWAEYELNDRGRVTRELFSLNNAVNAVQSGQSKNIDETEIHIKMGGPRFVEAPNYEGAFVQMYSMESYSEKSTVASDKRIGMEKHQRRQFGEVGI